MKRTVPALKDGLNVKTSACRDSLVCWYSEPRPGSLPVSLHGYMGLHTSSAKALFCRHPSFFSLFSLSLKGADQFTASSGGVRLIPALCDWLRRHKPSVVLFLPFSLSLIEGSGLLFSPLGSASLWL